MEIVGGAYNEPNTNLTSAESTIRNIVHGMGQQRDVLGADPSVAWRSMFSATTPALRG